MYRAVCVYCGKDVTYCITCDIISCVDEDCNGYHEHVYDANSHKTKKPNGEVKDDE